MWEAKIFRISGSRNIFNGNMEFNNIPDKVKLTVYRLVPRKIAEMLHIADGTIRNSLSRIYEKLNVRDRVQAPMVARKMGLLEE